jgi:hypothetical protein
VGHFLRGCAGSGEMGIGLGAEVLGVGAERGGWLSGLGMWCFIYRQVVISWPGFKIWRVKQSLIGIAGSVDPVSSRR